MRILTTKQNVSLIGLLLCEYKMRLSTLDGIVRKWLDITLIKLKRGMGSKSRWKRFIQ